MKRLPQDLYEDPDVLAQREYATHMAYRLLSAASHALIEGHAGTVRITPPRDPLFAAVAGQSLRVIAEAIRHDKLPLRFIQQLTTDLSASSDVDIENGPGDTTPEAITPTTKESNPQ